MRNWIFTVFMIVVLFAFAVGAVKAHRERVANEATTAEAIGRLTSALKQYESGVSAKDGFFENLTVRHLTITDSNAGLRILVHSNDDGSAQISFYGEHSILGGFIRVGKNGAIYSSLQGKPRSN